LVVVAVLPAFADVVVPPLFAAVAALWVFAGALLVAA
jgi:hypothetical protein